MWSFLFNFKTYLIMGIIISLIFAGFFRLQVKVAKAERDKALSELQITNIHLQQQNAAITRWQLQAKAQYQQLKKAEEVATLEKAAYEQRALHTLRKSISVDCSMAMKWGAVEAFRLTKQWDSSY